MSEVLRKADFLIIPGVFNPFTALEWSKQRELFGSKLIEKQGIQWYITQSVAKLYAIKTMLKDVSSYPLERLEEIEGKISFSQIPSLLKKLQIQCYKLWED